MSISRYFLFFFLLLAVNSIALLQAQDPVNEFEDLDPPDPALRAIDTLPPRVVKPFIRFGIDLSALARSYFEPEVRQYEASVDTEFRPNWFATIEGGTATVNSQREGFSYSSSGFFARIGADFNLLGLNYPQHDDLILVGLRYAYSSLQHEAPEYFIQNPYWGSHTGSVNKSNYNLHWLEFSGSVRTEVFRNFFMGWSLRSRIRLAESGNAILNPYYVPGFGHGRRRAPAMMHFSVYYRFGLR
jgi:hypothetical protein